MDREALILLARREGCVCDVDSTVITLDGIEHVGLCPNCPAWTQLKGDEE